MLENLERAWEEQDHRRGQPASRPRRKKAKKRQGHSFGFLFVSVLLLVALGGSVYWGVGWLQGTFGASDYESNPAKTPVNVVIEPGDGAIAIGEELFNKEVVASVKAFAQAAEADPNSKNIQPGTYRLFKEMPAKTALAYLLDPAKYMLVTKVTIPEGMVTTDIFAALAKESGIAVKEFQDAAKDPVKLGVDASWFGKREDGTPVRKSIEGFLFPATYSFQPEASAEDMLKEMVATFNAVVTDLDFLSVAQSKLGITPYEALIAASIIEKEAVLKVDFPKVAKVLYNRAYKDNGPCDRCLGLDSTINYWLTINGKDAKASNHITQAEIDDVSNPFNTHHKPGMPPGAISSPGKESMTAALNPGGVGNDVFFFQTIDKKGTMAYAKTYTEHRRASANACKNDPDFC